MFIFSTVDIPELPSSDDKNLKVISRRGQYKENKLNMILHAIHWHAPIKNVFLWPLLCYFLR
jgi:hypothetical protein